MMEIWEMDTDLFAAPWNAQLPSFVSWNPQPNPGQWPSMRSQSAEIELKDTLSPPSR
jgi:hypothetical protein